MQCSDLKRGRKTQDRGHHNMVNTYCCFDNEATVPEESKVPRINSRAPTVNPDCLLLQQFEGSLEDTTDTRLDHVSKKKKIKRAGATVPGKVPAPYTQGPGFWILTSEYKKTRDHKLYTCISTSVCVCVCAWKTGSHSLDQTDLEATMYVAQMSLKCSEFLLPQFPECWGYKYETLLSLANFFYSLDILSYAF